MSWHFMTDSFHSNHPYPEELLIGSLSSLNRQAGRKAVLMAFERDAFFPSKRAFPSRQERLSFRQEGRFFKST